MKTRTNAPVGTSAAPLLYWLLVVCGLAGLTIQRLDAPDDLLPLWAGTALGVALGQFVAWLRVRTWVLVVIGIAVLWISPIFFFVLYQGIRSPVETCVFAFLPAALGGYLLLSERGALISFWYPAVLWMLVILDGPEGGAAVGAFDTRTALPLVIALAGLFVAFVRARETRRAAIWSGNAAIRLAKVRPRNVLRASPVRAASQVAWTALVGAAGLVLAAWIAPHLWQKEEAKHQNAVLAQAARAGSPYATQQQEAPVCCADLAAASAKRVRVREYLPLLHGQTEAERAEAIAAASCIQCSDTTADKEGGYGFGAGYDWSYNGAYGYSGPTGGYDNHGGSTIDGTAGGGVGAGNGSPSYQVNPTVMGPTTSPSAPTVMGSTITTDDPLVTPTPVAPVVMPQNVATPTPTPIVTPTVPTVKPTVTPTPVAAQPASPKSGSKTSAVPVVLAPASAPRGPSAPPWESVLALCIGGLGLHLAMRALRRQLTLRHLARPFWAETLDQRISNHWQRILIALRDAGIHVARDEQPEALAKRVGIAGMDTCATILERVRHGVRVDADDLQTMDSAATAVYRAAREKAGITGRAAGLVRWPLA